MPGKATLRSLIIAELLLVISGAAAYSLEASSLPDPLRAFDEQQAAEPLSPTDYVLFLLVVLMLATLIAAWIGLLALWPPARPLYLLGLALTLSVTPFLGPYVETGLSYTLGNAAAIVTGIILALIDWSPLSALYVRAENHGPGAAVPHGDDPPSSPPARVA